MSWDDEGTYMSPVDRSRQTMACLLYAMDLFMTNMDEETRGKWARNTGFNGAAEEPSRTVTDWYKGWLVGRAGAKRAPDPLDRPDDEIEVFNDVAGVFAALGPNPIMRKEH